MLLFKLNQFIVDRSLMIKHPSGHSHETTESLLNILNQLVEGGFLKNNRIFILQELDWSQNERFIRDICSMRNLERLDLWDCELTMEDLLSVFRSCLKLVELRLKNIGSSPDVHLDSCPTLMTKEQIEEEYNELMLGFQRLRDFENKVMMELLR
jgi:hypothetical protein